MRKIRVIALREFLAGVRAKAFLITVLLMPVMLGLSIGLQLLFAKLDEGKAKKYAVIDRTPGGALALGFQKFAEAQRQALAENPKSKGLFGENVTFVIIPPSDPTPEAIGLQRFETSRKIENGELEGLIEIGSKLFEPPSGDSLDSSGKTGDARVVRFQARSAAAQQVRLRLETVVNEVVIGANLAKKGISLDEIRAQRVAVQSKSLTKLDPTTGAYVDAADETRIVNLILPGVLIGLMFMVIMVGATPAMHGVIEEKTLRIAEVLLGSVTPFQLMAGKLIGVIGVALTMAVVYLAGGYFLMAYFGLADMVPMKLIPWFLPMLLMALLLFGSLFIAIGAAASDIKDTQALLTPIMLIACVPFFALGPIMQDPNGPIARAASFFPFATPMLLVARESVPPGVPWWEMLAGIALVLATTLFCVWAAGRIFRVGILMQGKGARFADLVRWALRG
jgi:ABC-2 type transport system permease protein